MALSHAAARILPGLWCESWDDGVFEWKPLTLKARILPVHNEDFEQLLAELVTHKFITRFTVGEKNYGAVRNFCKYQRPKKPNSSGVLPEELRTYVGSIDPGSPPVPPELPTGTEPVGESARRREEGRKGGRKEGNKSAAPPPSSAGGKRAPGKATGYAYEGSAIRLSMDDYREWQRLYPHVADALLGLLAGRDGWLSQQREAERKNWYHSTRTWLANKNQEAAERRAAAGSSNGNGAAEPQAAWWEKERDAWRARLNGFFTEGLWMEQLWGPSPDSERCQVPAEVLAEFRGKSTGKAAMA